MKKGQNLHHYKLHFLFTYCDVEMKRNVGVMATDEIRALCEAGKRFKSLFTDGEWENGKVHVQGVGFGHI